LLPVQEMTTPEQWTVAASRGDCRLIVISVQGENGVGLRNSMPFLWMSTESGARDNRACRACTVTF
jgi:hypothetical protein